jgi:hypothetical protein
VEPGPDTGLTFLTMLFMANLDDHLHEEGAFDILRNQMRRYLDDKGGIIHCEGAQAVVATTVQFRVGIAAEKGPTGDDQPQCTKPTSSQRVEYVTRLQSLPEGFRAMVALNLLSLETMIILERIVLVDIEGVSASEYPEEPYPNIRKACPALSIPDGEDGPDMERLLCLALIRYC